MVRNKDYVIDLQNEHQEECENDNVTRPLFKYLDEGKILSIPTYKSI